METLIVKFNNASSFFPGHPYTYHKMVRLCKKLTGAEKEALYAWLEEHGLTQAAAEAPLGQAPAPAPAPTPTPTPASASASAPAAPQEAQPGALPEDINSIEELNVWAQSQTFGDETWFEALERAPGDKQAAWERAVHRCTYLWAASTEGIPLSKLGAPPDNSIKSKADSRRRGSGTQGWGD